MHRRRKVSGRAGKTKLSCGKTPAKEFACRAITEKKRQWLAVNAQPAAPCCFIPRTLRPLVNRIVQNAIRVNTIQSKKHCETHCFPLNHRLNIGLCPASYSKDVRPPKHRPADKLYLSDTGRSSRITITGRAVSGTHPRAITHASSADGLRHCQERGEEFRYPYDFCSSVGEIFAAPDCALAVLSISDGNPKP
jgi:hypothetical protein